jgi:lambda repressor-like predicted transcriptional regulator
MRLELERAAAEGHAQPSATRRRAREPDPATVERAVTIKARLIEAGISQATLARAAVVTRSYVCHALSGRHRADRVMACALELLRQAGAPKKGRK